jgi:thymidylate synthase
MTIATIRGWFPVWVDQLQKLINNIARDPASRRHVVSYWHPYWSEFVELPPCHTLWQIKMHTDGSMSLHLYCRSIDVFLGLPYNIASYAFLLYMLAKVCYSKPNSLTISFGDLHLYKNHIEQAKQQLQRTPTELPTVTIQAPMHSISRFHNLLAIRWEHIQISGYNPQAPIYAPVAV